MRRTRLLPLLLVSIWLGACSDDTTPPKPDSGIPDKGPGVDLPKKPDAGVDAKPAPDQGTTAKYSGLITVIQVEGNPNPGAPKPDAGPPVKIIRVAASFDKPDPVIKPDFIDTPTPPNCVAYKWTATTPPNQTAGDAGKLTVTGHLQASYFDATKLPPAPQQLPKTIECNRTAVGSFFRYDCGLPQKAALASGDFLDDTVDLTITAAGGKEIASFTQAAIKAGPKVSPKGKLYDIDPGQPLKIEWQTTSALFVVTNLQAYLQDGSEMAEITCSNLGAFGSQTVPAGALAVLPKPTATNPLIIQTALVGVTITGTSATWGDYKIGVGRGEYAVTCRTPTGLCP